MLTLAGQIEDVVRRPSVGWVSRLLCLLEFLIGTTMYELLSYVLYSLISPQSGDERATARVPTCSKEQKRNKEGNARRNSHRRVNSRRRAVGSDKIIIFNFCSTVAIRRLHL